MQAMPDFELRELELGDEESFRKARREFEQCNPEMTFAFDFNDHTPFAYYVDRLKRQRQGLDLPEGFVPSAYFVAVVNRTIIGRVSLRFQLTDFLLNYGGHLGYGVIPSFRRQGYATAMLKRSMTIAQEEGLARILLTSDETNEASIRVIESCGGKLEDRRTPPDSDVPKLRYWITLNLSTNTP